jgi:hypothetical protein
MMIFAGALTEAEVTGLAGPPANAGGKAPDR